MTLYKQANCFICTCDIRTEKLDDVHCLWDDEGWSGRPVCWGCYWLLKMYCPDKLDVPVPIKAEIKLRFKSGEIGLEKWM